MYYLVFLLILLGAIWLYSININNNNNNNTNTNTNTNINTNTNTNTIQKGGANYNGINQQLQFSELNQDISHGNNLSYSKIVNPLAQKDQWTDNCNKPSYVYFGSPNPLLHEMKPMAVPKDTMFYFANAVSSPACCPSAYSTSSGCVCVFPKNIYPCKNEKPYEPPIPGDNSWQ